MAQKKTVAPARTLRPLPVRVAALHAKLMIAVVVGVAAAFYSPPSSHWPTRMLIGWDIGVALYLITTCTMFWRADVGRLRNRAREQDEGEFVILLLSLGATVASFAAIVIELGGAKQSGHVAIAALLCASTILLSWSFVHTIFSLHYAHEYYGERRDGKIGGLDFPGSEEPDYWDFLYFSLVIGMTSQVSDVQVTSKIIRRAVSVHGVLSFFFNLTVLALTVNMLSNLI
jgi:uncharacterized membrane protein